MRNSSINESKKLFLTVGAIKHNLVCNVKDLKHLVFLDSIPSIELAFLDLKIFLIKLVMINIDCEIFLS
jgi:hypothetical protein